MKLLCFEVISYKKARSTELCFIMLSYKSGSLTCDHLYGLQIEETLDLNKRDSHKKSIFHFSSKRCPQLGKKVKSVKQGVIWPLPAGKIGA